MRLRLATAQISPNYTHPEHTLRKILTCISHASRHNATLLAFPESLLPGFPIWPALLPPSHPATHTLFKHFSATSIYADGSEIAAIRDAARRGGVSVSVGVSEKMRGSPGTMWNANVIVDELGEVRVWHRKIVPTWFERLVWAKGDGEGLRSVDVGVREMGEGLGLEDGGVPATGGTVGMGDAGGHMQQQQGRRDTEDGKVERESQEKQTIRIGALICGENTNPLARYAVMSPGQQVHVSSWPAIWPTRMPMLETTETPLPSSSAASSSSHGKNYDNVQSNRIRAAAHCFEAKCYGIMSAAHLSPANISELLSFLPPPSGSANIALRAQFSHALESSPRAPSMFLSPTGSLHPSFIVNELGQREEREMLRDEEGVLFADVDTDECIEGKQFHDLVGVGGYQRGDIFDLRVDRRRRKGGAVQFVDGEVGRE